jgi:hypothetical protein
MSTALRRAASVRWAVVVRCWLAVKSPCRAAVNCWRTWAREACCDNVRAAAALSSAAPSESSSEMSITTIGFFSFLTSSPGSGRGGFLVLAGLGTGEGTGKG